MKKNIYKRNNSGFTIFIAVMVSALMLIAVLSISSIAYKETILSGAGRDSALAFYAADSGIECALFWDYQNPGHAHSAFLSPVQEITCGSDTNPVTYYNSSSFNVSATGVGINPASYPGYDPSEGSSNGPTVGNPAQSFFIISFDNDTCAKISVVKYYDVGNSIRTTIESKGQTDCDNPSNTRRFERAIRVIDYQ